MPGSRRPVASRALARAVRGVATVTVVLMALLVVAPQPGATRVGSQAFPVSWLWSWLVLPAWSAPPSPPTPKQESGSAKGLGHSVPLAATRAGKGNGKPRDKGVGELPSFSPHTPEMAPTDSGVDPDKDPFDARTSRRIPSAGAATSDVFQNADGSYTRRVYGNAVNYKAADGSWQPIDTALSRKADGRWHENANSLGVDLADTRSGTTWRLRG